MTTAPTASPIDALIIIDTLSVRHVPDITERFIDIATGKLDRNFDDRGALCTTHLHQDVESIVREIQRDMKRLSSYPQHAVIIVGDFSPAEWDALVAEFPDVEMCNITSADLAA